MNTEVSTEGRTIEIVVVISKHDHKHLKFDREEVKGLEIKTQAGVPPENDLAVRRHHDKLELITNEETVHIHEGEHFYVFPPGTIS
jgi:hypothetical protein